MKHLILDYYLDTDAYNYILKQRVLQNSGKNVGSERYDIIGYYGKNLKLLLASIIDLYVLENIQNKEFEHTLDFIQQIIKLRDEVVE